MKVVFMGTPDFAVGTLEAILEAGHEVAAVVTQIDKPKGRGNMVVMTPVKECALLHNLPVFQPLKARDAAFLEEMNRLAPDVIVVAAYGQIIPKALLELPKYGCLNVHASLLPKYRGAAPIQWSILDGEEKTGVTIMQMDEGLDTGDMLTVREIVIEKDETGGSLFDKLSACGASLLVDTLKMAEEGKLSAAKQPAESTTAYARMITKADGLINWTDDAEKIERLIRAMNPWPSAYTTLDGKSLKIWNSRVLDETEDGEIGSVIRTDKDGIVVQTGSGRLILTEVQLQGKKRMMADAFLRGYEIKAGTKLG